MKQATIYSIAQALEVSASTVSRAFSRPDLVKPEVRERVLATARELGYAPNRAARGLATGRTGLYGLLVPDVTNPFFPPLIRAIQQAAARVDAGVLLVDSEGSGAAETALVSRIKAQVDGLLVASPRLATAKLKEALGAVPSVIINRAAQGLATVVCDNTAALREAATHLHDLGHRRFALMRGPSASWAAGRRAHAIRSWAQEAGVSLAELGHYEAVFVDGRRAAAQIVESGATAVFAFDDLMAAGVIAGLSDLGETVPRDRSIIGCDDVLLARTMTPGLTTVTAPLEELGRQSVLALHGLLEQRPVPNVQLQGTLTVRGTTGPPP
ncbi:LacI family DNA-binding transcriptional regulator [Occultella gossypii]|uniref:LacI family DNA-binding transcriptional regulator n=1 Tax=Occultella gossypii TaxID=2800820 RepID=A0ABS7SIC9_9MICO|nr:LacI family DNA-binding transcriptional regulator [Occultella gossypii]MBZ2199540.1 LacI family DNA-binding transcriptional regulator [Occultella gossypii]